MTTGQFIRLAGWVTCIVYLRQCFKLRYSNIWTKLKNSAKKTCVTGAEVNCSHFLNLLFRLHSDDHFFNLVQKFAYQNFKHHLKYTSTHPINRMNWSVTFIEKLNEDSLAYCFNERPWSSTESLISAQRDFERIGRDISNFKKNKNNETSIGCLLNT